MREIQNDQATQFGATETFSNFDFFKESTNEKLSEPESLSQRQSSQIAKAFLPDLELTDARQHGQEEATSPEATDEPQETDEKPENDDRPKQIASEISRAILSGDARQVSTLMKAASHEFAGDETKIKAMGLELSEILADKGFDVKNGAGVINVHRHDADQAVSFEFATMTRSGRLDEYKEQAYDWVTKNDVDTKVDSLIAEFGKVRPEHSRGLKDANQLATMLESAAEGKNFNDVHRELARSALYAFRSGGMDEVRKLESGLNRKTKSENGVLFLEDGNRLTIHLGKLLSSDEALKALEKGDLKERGIVKTPRGYFRMVTEGREVKLQKE